MEKATSQTLSRFESVHEFLSSRLTNALSLDLVS
jgi:hypothetical protein